MTFYPQDGGIGGGTPRDDTWYNPPWAAPHRSTGQRIAGLLSAALQGAAGQQSTYAQMVLGDRQNEQQGEQQNLLMQLRSQAEAEQHTRDRADGNADWMMRQQWQLDHPDVPQPIQLAKAAGLQEGTPEYKAALTAAIPGYANTQGVLEMKSALQQQLAAQRAAASAGLKAQPTYAQSHPKPTGGSGGGGGHYEYRMVNGQLMKRRVN